MDFRNDILPLKNRLYRLALRIVRNPQEAEDIVQDTLMKVWNMRGSWGEIESMEAFSLTICRNLSLDQIKKKSATNLSLDEVDADRIDHCDDPLRQLTAKDGVERIRAVLDSLPEKQRTCMQLRDFEGMAYKEISNVVGITEDQVKINIFRARKAVKSCLLDENPEILRPRTN